MYLQVRVETNGSSRGEGEGEEVAEREPVPELAEDQQTHRRLHAHVPRPRLEGDSHISASCCKQNREGKWQYPSAQVSFRIRLIIPYKYPNGRHSTRGIDHAPKTLGGANNTEIKNIDNT